MAARLTDKKKKKIIADYVQLGSYNAVGKINGVSGNTVKKIVNENADFARKCEQKKEENTADILAYMETRRGTVCEIIDKALNILNDEAKLASAPLSQITTALGTLIDKWAIISDKTGTDQSEEDELSKSLREFGEGLKSDGEQEKT